MNVCISTNMAVISTDSSHLIVLLLSCLCWGGGQNENGSENDLESAVH